MNKLSYAFTAKNRFLNYVQVDTQSDPQSTAKPSTEKQKDLARMLVNELHDMGITNAEMDDYGIVYAHIDSNTDKQVPGICFCSHIDTAPDSSGTNVKPIVHNEYNGQPIALPDDPTQIISVEKYPYLRQHIGKTIITASGATLLGADDKSGLAIIMDIAYYLQTHPEVKHGPVALLFTPDEEVGRGTENVNRDRIRAAFAYTLDGGEAGSLETETFSANMATLYIGGVSAHPGYAKGLLVNALKLAGELLHALPGEEWSPETTEGMQGFVHPISMEGNAEQAIIRFIIRDFDTALLEQHQNRLLQLARESLSKVDGATVRMEVREQYRNMKEVLDHYPQVAEYAAEAIGRAWLQVKTMAIRGGTDGSKLSFMGLPCPNLFTGMYGIHSKTEWIGVEDMEKSVETLIHLVQIWEEKS